VPPTRSFRLVALAVLLALASAPLCAIGVGLHLTGHDDHGPGAMKSLARVATHGHHHDHEVADHEHAPLRSPAPQVPAPAVAAAAQLGGQANPAPGATRAGFEFAPPPTESPPLFYAHCALLL
jgi:hypothetical protein